MKMLLLSISLLIISGCQRSNIDELWEQLGKCEETFHEPCFLVAAPESAEKDLRDLYAEMLSDE